MKQPLKREIRDALPPGTTERIGRQTFDELLHLTQGVLKANKLDLGAEPLDLPTDDPAMVLSSFCAKLQFSYLQYRLGDEPKSTVQGLYAEAEKAIGKKQAKEFIRNMERIVDNGIAKVIGHGQERE